MSGTRRRAKKKVTIIDDVLETYRLWRIRKTLSQMCRDRGYIVSQEELDLELEDFCKQYGTEPSSGKPTRGDLTMIFMHRDNKRNVFVFLPKEARLGIKSLKALFLMMRGLNCTHAVVVIQDGVTQMAKAAIEDFKPLFLVEQFREPELLINITKHELVPEHEVLSDEEKKELLQRYKLKEKQMPRIQTGDPVARYYGLQRGQVIKITRPSKTAGRYITYRLAV
ncbi:hypothetical protein L596_006102 [Steinernema carpocapsae]|uniref:DNA-directed RNA polymerases I, II, and III subunit RPABC1 n=1 Tax=Steinernema carpocapsae TaxID=34508 RepID=A0A4U8V2G0_STECR|nr:hypothetical protein L596_006102 [Steinernema carpocapsae]